MPPPSDDSARRAALPTGVGYCPTSLLPAPRELSWVPSWCTLNLGLPAPSGGRRRRRSIPPLAIEVCARAGGDGGLAPTRPPCCRCCGGCRCCCCCCGCCDCCCCCSCTTSRSPDRIERRRSPWPPAPAAAPPGCTATLAKLRSSWRRRSVSVFRAAAFRPAARSGVSVRPGVRVLPRRCALLGSPGSAGLTTAPPLKLMV